MGEEDIPSVKDENSKACFMVVSALEYNLVWNGFLLEIVNDVIGVVC